MTSSRGRRIRTEFAISVGGMVILVLLFISALWLGRHGQLGSGLSPGKPAGVILGTVGMAVIAGWWCFWGFRLVRAMDEYKRHVELASWFWGGLLGLMASVPVYAFVTLGGLHWLDPQRPMGRDLANAFAHGYMLPIVMQVAAAVFAALWMRLSRR